jgi:hypothetical protein
MLLPTGAHCCNCRAVRQAGILSRERRFSMFFQVENCRHTPSDRPTTVPKCVISTRADVGVSEGKSSGDICSGRCSTSGPLVVTLLPQSRISFVRQLKMEVQDACLLRLGPQKPLAGCGIWLSYNTPAADGYP